jgi:hypothetical protein
MVIHKLRERGAGQQGFIVSLLERVSKYTKLVLAPDRTAETVKAAILQALGPDRRQLQGILIPSDHRCRAHADAAPLKSSRTPHLSSDTTL